MEIQLAFTWNLHRNCFRAIVLQTDTALQVPPCDQPEKKDCCMLDDVMSKKIVLPTDTALQVPPCDQPVKTRLDKTGFC